MFCFQDEDAVEEEEEEEDEEEGEDDEEEVEQDEPEQLFRQRHLGIQTSAR